MARAEETIRQTSALHALLMENFARGLMSGQLVHRIAQAAQKDIESTKDGFQMPDLEHLAKLQRADNVTRSVHRMLSKSSELSLPLYVPMRYSDGLHDTSILLPHELFAFFYQKQDLWEKNILADSQKLEPFWLAMASHPVLEGHPLKTAKGKNWMKKCIPLSLHGDEVPCFGVGKIWSRSVLAFSWCSMIQNALGGTCDNIMLYVWGVFEKFCVKSTASSMGTMETFYQVLHWSLLAMWNGQWPREDWRGIPYPPGSAEACLGFVF